MWFGWGWGMMFFVPLCFIFGAIAIYYFLISSRRNCHSNYAPSYQSRSRASEILAERYAKGEISREEFLQIKKELER
jgi:putative membrane protein